MRRRKFLSVASIGGISTIAGCSLPGSGGGSGDQEDEQEVMLGEVIERDGLSVVVDQYTTAAQYVPWTELPQGYTAGGETPQNETAPEYSAEYIERPPTAGGTWIISRLRIRHVGEGKKYFPGPAALEYYHNDSSIEITQVEAPHFWAGDRFYRSYVQTARSQGAISTGAYHGVEITGWVVGEIPFEYIPTELFLGVTWGDENPENGETAWWQYGEENETDNSNGNSTNSTTSV